MKKIRRRLWQFIHDRLEQAWNWVYYHKLVEDDPPAPRDPMATYQMSMDWVVSNPSPRYQFTVKNLDAPN
jgi:hypothetical protein